jgi:nicotinamidase-related amidase
MSYDPAHALIERHDSLLIVVDVQDNFTSKLEAAQSQRLLDRVRWLMHVARWCEVPVVVTVEDIVRAGGPSPEVAAAMSPGGRVFDKLTFGLADQPDIFAAVAATGRQTAVLVGLETDVCVMQSALGLLARGFRVAVIEDATGSPGASHAAGLARMRAAGALITDTKGLFYEWMRTLEECRRFDATNPDLPPPRDLVL